MAYTPINWQTGDTITAEKLNKMDNGIGVFVVNITADGSSSQLDKTWQEIYDAADADALVLLRYKNNGEIFYNEWVTNIAGDGSWYAVYAHSFISGGEIEYGTTTASGYPSKSN